MSVLWPNLEILAAGLVTPVGMRAATSAAAVRAGIVRIRLTDLLDRQLNSVRAGFLADPTLDRLAAASSVPKSEGSPYRRRLLQLAAPALLEAAQDLRAAVPLFLALPEQAPGDLLEELVRSSGTPVDTASSQVVGGGRAAGLLGIERAASWIAERHGGLALIGAVDSYATTDRLAALEEDERLRVEGACDGFIPGEAAAFLLVGAGARARARGGPLARITAYGVGQERGHFHSDFPHLGDGLSQALREALSSVSTARAVRCVYAGFNGESFWAKEWGVAFTRNADRFSDGFQIEHPAECTGDVGAALGPMMLALAAIGHRKKHHAGPTLVWCGSDRELRAAALLESGEERP